MCDTALALSLVRAHLLLTPDYLSWVPAYTTIRWSKKRAHSVTVGGHYRRKALHARMLNALQCTCHLQNFVSATQVPPPPSAHIERRSKNGDLLQRHSRELQWS